jgi:hypothetical protein
MTSGKQGSLVFAALIVALSGCSDRMTVNNRVDAVADLEQNVTSVDPPPGVRLVDARYLWLVPGLMEAYDRTVASVPVSVLETHPIFRVHPEPLPSELPDVPHTLLDAHVYRYPQPGVALGSMLKAYQLKGRLVLTGAFEMGRTTGEPDVVTYLYDPSAQRVALLACLFPEPYHGPGVWQVAGSPSDDELNFLVWRWATEQWPPNPLVGIDRDECTISGTL